MEDMCDEFVIKLHGFIQNDVKTGFNEKKLNALFSRAIDSLPSEELSKHIDENYVVYYKKFCRLFQNELSTIEIEDDLLEFPFVNYSKNVNELGSLQDSDQCNAFTGMLLQADEKDLIRLFEKAKKMLSENNFFNLCIRLLIVKPSNIPLLRLALQATSCLSEKFERLSSDISSAEDYKLLLEEIKLCCSLIANDYKTAVNVGRYSHNDIMAALLSIYTDAYLQLTSAESSEFDHQTVAKDLITYINILLHDKSSLYDIFLQVNSSIGIDLKKVLVFSIKLAINKNAPPKDDCLSYIKFLVLCKQAVELSQECQCSDEEKYFKVKALKTQQPNGLADWLLRFSSMDDVMLTKSNKLWDLVVDSEEMSGKLLEVIEAEAEKLSPQKVETNKDGEKFTETEEVTNTVPETLDGGGEDSAAGLFFFDTKPSKKKAYQPDDESDISKSKETPIHIDSENEEEEKPDTDAESDQESVDVEKEEDDPGSDCFVRLRNLSESDINSYSSANEGIQQEEASKERSLRKRRKINKEMDNGDTTDDCLSPKKKPDRSKKRKTSTRKGKTARRLSKIQELTDSDEECSGKDNKMASNSSPSEVTLPDSEISKLREPETPRRSRRLLKNT